MVSIATADDWQIFRGPAGDGSSTLKNLPVEWAIDKNVTWKTDLPGEGCRPPVVYKGVVYLTAAIAQSKTDETSAYDLTVFGINLANGEVRWKKTAFVSRQMRHAGIKKTVMRVQRRSSMTTSYMCISDIRGRLLSLTGEVIWKTVSIEYKPVHGNGGTPVIVDDTIVFSVDGAATAKVIALDLSNGEVRWTFDRKSNAPRKFSFSTPALIEVDGKRQIVSPGSDVVHGLDAETGEMIWKVKYDGYSVIPKPVFRDGLVYVCTSYNAPGSTVLTRPGKGISPKRM